MANTQAVCNSFKTELLNGVHAFGATVTRGATTKDTFKLALFLASATLNKATTAYSTTGELAGTGNYTQGGVTLTNGNAPANASDTAYWTPSADAQWTSFTSSGAFDCALLYNSTQSNKAVAVYTFASQSITSGTFTLTMPANDSTNALLRLA
jgi:hypothetical protein